MNLKKRIIFSIFVLFPIGFLILHRTVLATPSYPLIDSQIIDHNKNKEEAKNWAKKYYKSWSRNLSEKEEKLLNKLLEPSESDEENNLTNINYQLKVYGGDLSTRPVDIPQLNKELQKNVDQISQIINRKEGTLQKPLIVYKNETLEDVLHIKDKYFRDLDRSLKEDKLLELKKDFVYGQHSEFRVYDLFEDSNQDEMIKWKIKLPPGTRTGLIAGNKIVIDKDSAFEVTKIKVITQTGKQLLRIEAKNIAKEIVEDTHKPLVQKIKQQFTTELDLPPDKTFLDFKLKGSANSFIIKKLGELLHKFMNSIDNEFIEQTLLFIAEKGGRIIFTDQMLYTLSEIYEPYERTYKDFKDVKNAIGIYNIDGNRTIAIHIPEDLKEGNEIGVETLFHEFGHAADHYIGRKVNQEEFDRISETPKFKEIFAKEKEKLTKYGSTNSAEFFAEAFWLMHDIEYKNIVKQKAPETYTFIKEILNSISQ